MIMCRTGYNRSRRNVSSVAGSARIMSGSFSMWSPSRVSGSIFKSSRGNWESISKLMSEGSESFGKLGGDSPLTAARNNKDFYSN